MKQIKARQVWKEERLDFKCLIVRADGSKEALYQKENTFYGPALIKRKVG